MAINDKRSIIERMKNGETFTVELGCGTEKKDPAAIGVDMLDYECVDVVGDVIEVLASFPANSVTKISSSHFMEHVKDVPTLMSEISRVLMTGGTAKAVVPHFSNPFYYSDPTHSSPFGLYTMAYFCEQNIFARGVPSYAIGVPLVLDSIKLGFKSIRPRYISHVFKRVFGIFVNCSTYTKEFYEEHLCWLIPCYEIHLEMHKK